MKMRLLALMSGALLLSACGKEAPPVEPAQPAETAPKPAVPVAGITPVDVPAGYGYPGSRDEFQAWADTWQIDNITTAAWNLWAGMTSDSGQTWNGTDLPVWDTWCGNEEVFSAQGCNALDRPAHAFRRPAQIAHTALKTGAAVASDTSVVSFNKFNPSMAAYLATQHPGPGNANYSYISMQDLAKLNAAWPAETPISARKVVDSPYQPDNGDTVGFSGMETKPVMFLVKSPSNLPTGQSLTPVPLWQGPAQSTAPNNAVPESWQTCVLLDPTAAASADPTTAPSPATPAQVQQVVPNSKYACDPAKYLYAPLSTIYNAAMDQAEADAWNNAQGGNDPGVKAQAGDYTVLAAMHVNTKTISNWTWQTYWWQPGTDTPNSFPGSKQGMTDNIAGAWRNYAMCTAWNQTKGNASKDMVVCFNPYLETSKAIPAGQTSNCMSCHGNATAGSPLGGTQGSLSLPTLNYPPAYKQPIDFNNDPRYSTFTRTDFSWAIPVNAISTPAEATPPAAGGAK